MKKTISVVMTVTFLVTGIGQEIAGIDFKKVFASGVPSWYMPVAGALGNLGDSSSPIQSTNADLFTGSAQTSVPIFAPPGRLGLTPQIALGYSSQAGNSWLGVGWDLSSDAIVRSTKRGVPHYNDSEDTFILSLQGVHSELVEIGPNEYRAKQESGAFLKVVKSGSSWLVYNKSGAQFTFGESANSRHTNALGTFAWYLEKVKDIQGNTICYTYGNEAGKDLYLARIDYNGNETENFPATHSIEFTVESRPDVLFSYMTGARVETAKRLKKIEVKVQGALARKYTLQYEETPIIQRSRLYSVLECGTDGATCLPLTTFTYQNMQPTFETSVLWPEPNPYIGPISRLSGDAEVVTTADMDGDGLPDRVKKESDTEWRVYKNLGLGHETDPQLWDNVQGATGVLAAMRANSTGSGSYANLLDLNGDGRLDRVVQGTAQNPGGTNGWAVQYNTGENLSDAVYFGPVLENQYIRKEYLFGDWQDAVVSTWDTLDMNNDGYLDRLHAYTDNLWHVYFGIPGGFEDHTTNWGPVLLYPAKDASCDYGIRCYDGDSRITATKHDLMDVNGDGLPDRIIQAGDGVGGVDNFTVQFNNGRGFEQPVAFGPSIDRYVRHEHQFGDSGPLALATDWDLIDMNADGLLDRVGANQGAADEWYVYLNKGNGFSTTPVIWGPIEGVWAEDRVIRVYDPDTQNASLDVMDVNGDGLLDRVRSGSGEWYVQFGSGPYPDLLKTIENGRGGVTTFTYKPSTQYYNGHEDGLSDLPYPVITVSKVTYQDGLGHGYELNYDYADGLYDAEDREFRGFSRARVIDARGNYTDRWFYQDDVFKGKNYLTETRDSSENLYTQVWNTWRLREVYPGVTFAYVEETTNWLYDGNETNKLSENLYLYDDYGNVQETIFWGEVDTVDWDTPDGDEKRVQTEYTYNPDLWIMNKPKHSAAYDVEWNRIQESWFYYDNHADFDDPPVQGRLTRKEELVRLGGERLSVEMAYDDFGNLESVRDERNYTTINEYDPLLHLYLVRVTNPLGHVQELVYDPLIAQITQSRDQNNQVSITRYDSLGRTIKVISPLDTEAAPTQAVYYDDATIPNRVVTHLKASEDAPALTLDDNTHTGYLTSYSFHDGLGREIGRRSPAEDSAKQIVSGFVTFDERGQIREQYAPYFADFRKTYATAPPEIPHAVFQYDALGRKTRVDYPDGTHAETAYDDFVKTVTDQNGHQKRYTTDVYGNLTKVEELNNGQTYTTQYEYDPMNRLTKTIDALGHETQMVYDMLGRKEEMIDSNMGYWIYTYDENGNLLTQTDAKNQTIAFTYDELNRLIQKTYPDNTHIDYVYDSCPPETCGGLPGENYPTGRLLKVEDFSGVQVFRYDKLGRVLQDKKSLDDGQDYSFTRIYDPLGRVHTLEYPDGEILTLTFNPMGEAETLSLIPQDPPLTPIITNVNYNASGQITKIEYGNGVTTDYSYNPQTLRLSDLQTLAPSGGSPMLQQYHYEFDNVGNVQDIVDSVNTNTQHFQYDDLDRLTQATGSYGTRTYAYDAIGNMIQKGPAQLQYTNPLHPQAVTRYIQGARITTYQYDLNGNMIKRDNESLYYDYDNRLVKIKTPPDILPYPYPPIPVDHSELSLSIEKPESVSKTVSREAGAKSNVPPPPRTVATYVYDASGQRVKKTAYSRVTGDDSQVTYYLGKDYEVEYNSTSSFPPEADPPSAETRSLTRKAFFLGSTRIAEKEIPQGEGAVSHLRFFHQDHLGSTNLVTNDSGFVTLLMEYLPYGEVKLRTGSDVVSHTFTGHEEDPESNLIYANARYIDPKLGRFITADPTVQNPSDPQDLNRYAYCRNNPVRFIDPTGLGWFSKLWKKIKKALISALLVIVTAVLWALPGTQPIAAVFTSANTYLWAAAGAGATLTLDTGSGRDFQRKFAKEVFVDGLGLHPKVASFIAGMISHTLVSSAYYIGASSLFPQPNSGTDFTQEANKEKLLENAPREDQVGGGGAAKIHTSKSSTATSHFFERGLSAGEIAWKDVPIIGTITRALNIRHTAFTGEIGGQLVDSTSQPLFNLSKGAIWGSPWTATCHQVTFNTMTQAGATGLQAVVQTASRAGWSYGLSSSLYGVNGAYGVSGIYAGYKNRDNNV